MHGGSTRPGSASIRRPVPRVPHCSHITSRIGLARFPERSGRKFYGHPSQLPQACDPVLFLLRWPKETAFAEGIRSRDIYSVRGGSYDSEWVSGSGISSLSYHHHFILTCPLPLHACNCRVLVQKYTYVLANMGDPKRANSAALCLLLRWGGCLRATVLPRM
ncbi:hypothetical protein VTN31DRAFT_4569 [Thermomyces dupontii]|uniref:uncharacterized protein n=1 Tax=Talaromyces thermophilus TaxID=28565 RepID=UPI0037421FB2